MELGSNLNGSSIVEGVDVYFDCNIKANPWINKVMWMRGVSIIEFKNLLKFKAVK